MIAPTRSWFVCGESVTISRHSKDTHTRVDFQYLLCCEGVSEKGGTRLRWSWEILLLPWAVGSRLITWPF